MSAEPTSTVPPASADRGDRMRAVVRSEYGSPDVLGLATVDRPAIEPETVLVRVVAAGVNAGDVHLLRGTPYFTRLMFGGLRRPDIPVLGMDVAGRVEAVGDRVTAFEPGDVVVGDVSECGYGGFADYVTATADALVPKPPSVSFEDAAATPAAGVTALQALRDDGSIESGDRVLVNGASGGVGSFAVQLAAAFGATVTGVASPSKLEFVRSLGADRVVDYTKTAYTATGDRYDLVLDIAAAHSIRANLRALRPEGRYVMVGGPAGRFLTTMALGPLVSRIADAQYGTFELDPKAADLTTLTERLVDGSVEPAVDRTFPLDETADAIRYLESGRVRGKVVVTTEGAEA